MKWIIGCAVLSLIGVAASGYQHQTGTCDLVEVSGTEGTAHATLVSSVGACDSFLIDDTTKQLMDN